MGAAGIFCNENSSTTAAIGQDQPGLLMLSQCPYQSDTADVQLGDAKYVRFLSSLRANIPQ